MHFPHIIPPRTHTDTDKNKRRFISIPNTYNKKLERGVGKSKKGEGKKKKREGKSKRGRFFAQKKMRAKRERERTKKKKKGLVYSSFNSRGFFFLKNLINPSMKLH